jgi:hypothetical protein
MSLIEMIEDGDRYCDICEGMIPKGNHYAVSVIPKQNVEIARSTLPCEGTMDASGNLRLDICLDCRMGMSLESDETVN